VPAANCCWQRLDRWVSDDMHAMKDVALHDSRIDQNPIAAERPPIADQEPELADLVVIDDVSSVVSDHDATAFPEDLADLLQPSGRLVRQVQGVNAPMRELEEAEAGVGKCQVDLPVGDKWRPVGPRDD